MRSIVQGSRFKKDLKCVRKHGCDERKLVHIVGLLVEGSPIPERTVPHMLVGKYRGVMECHITSDWLLLYEITNTQVYLYRTGSHSDLFDN